MPDVSLTFATDLWDGFETICKKTDEGMDTCRYVLKFFTKRASIEGEYCKSLRSLSNKYCSKIEERGQIGKSWATIINVTAAHAESYQHVHDGITSNVVFHVAALIKDLEGKRKQLIQEGQKLRSGLQDKLDAMRKAQNKYEKLVREAKLMAEKASERADQESANLIIKTEKKLEDAATAEEEYKISIMESNEYQGMFYREKMPKLLTDLQHFELKRIRLLKSNIQNFSSLLKDLAPNLIEPLPHLMDAVSCLDHQEEVQNFIREHKTYKPLPIFEPYKFEPSSEGRLVRIGAVNGKGGTLHVKPINATFGISLEDLMANQSHQYPELDIPKIQSYLQDIILQLDGPSSEGIFRLSANLSEAQNFKKQMDQGVFQLVGNPSDMRVHASSLLKTWLRELPTPLIPHALYDICVQNPQNALEILPKIPNLNRLVLTRLIHFLQIFVQPEFAEKSKMGLSNLAVIFSPVLLRCPAEDIALLNTTQAQEFVETLITNLPDLSKSVYSKYIIDHNATTSTSTSPTPLSPLSPRHQASFQPAEPSSAGGGKTGLWRTVETSKGVRGRGNKQEWARSSPSASPAVGSRPRNTPLVTITTAEEEEGEPLDSL